MAITGENSFNGQSLKCIIIYKLDNNLYIILLMCKYKSRIRTYQTPVTGSASFPLTIKSGNNMEKTQPLKKKKKKSNVFL